jgi:hypothetical protein
MKSITPKRIYYIAAICLLFILGTQACLVLDFFKQSVPGWFMNRMQ